MCVWCVKLLTVLETRRSLITDFSVVLVAVENHRLAGRLNGSTARPFRERQPGDLPSRLLSQCLVAWESLTPAALSLVCLQVTPRLPLGPGAGFSHSPWGPGPRPVGTRVDGFTVERRNVHAE